MDETDENDRVLINLTCSNSSPGANDDWHTISGELQSIYLIMMNKNQSTSNFEDKKLIIIPPWLDSLNSIANVEFVKQFTIEENDDEMIRNFKLLRLAIDVFRTGMAQSSLITGFFKHFFYCLDESVGECLDLKRQVNTQQLVRVVFNQSTKIPDWKVGILVVLAQMIHRYFLNEWIGFYLFLIQYYNIRAWEERFIEMTDMDYKLLNELFTIPIDKFSNLFKANLAKVVYQHFQCYNTKLKILPKLLQELGMPEHNTLMETFKHELNYDMQMIVNESSRNLSSESIRKERILKIFYLCKVFYGFKQFGSEITEQFKYLHLSLLQSRDEEIVQESLEMLHVAPNISSATVASNSIELIVVLTELFEHRKESIREEAYKWCSKLLVRTTCMIDAPLCSKQILNALMNAPVLTNNLIELATSAFNCFKYLHDYNEQYLNFFHKIVEILRISINNDKERVEITLRAIPQIVDLDTEIRTVILNLPLNDLVNFCLTNEISIPTEIITIIMGITGSGTELVKLLLCTSDTSLHCVLADLLNKNFVETGSLLISQEEIDRLINQKLSISQFFKNYEINCFIYKVAHFYSDTVGLAIHLNACPAFMFDQVDGKGKVPEIVVLNYLNLLEIILDREFETISDNVDIIMETLEDISTLGYPLKIRAMIERILKLLRLHDIDDWRKGFDHNSIPVYEGNDDDLTYW
ncbi:predicted protein [Naegleria gruberi]|uniref:Predicted protein n=1 Tax=Naegleria gruberi TaxID=5762 RepID=D2V8Z6_NAEGR|nr:uncharacterized protein NAEGRDRAFT_65337 [Naegleria gruberi]EFC46777.1 predicted protein [Naegleria gruberi]|eukprot:XP_002679521.1 predicted protein [Naegleria gruberi strain NEG-M]